MLNNFLTQYIPHTVTNIYVKILTAHAVVPPCHMESSIHKSLLKNGEGHQYFMSDKVLHSSKDKVLEC